MATLKDVAKLACVDVSTVSRALNNTSYVHPDTKAKIYAAAKELGYRPNAMAQALRQGRRHTIGVVLPRLHLAIHAEILQGIESYAAKKGYATLICVTEDDPALEKNSLDKLRNGMVDGIIITGTGKNGRTIKDIKASGIPIVQAIRQQERKITSIVGDYETCGYDAVKYLYEKGCREIGLIVGDLHLQPYKERYDGYCKAIKKYNLNKNLSTLDRPGNTFEFGYDCAFQLIQNNPNLDSIMAAVDIQGLGAIRAICDSGKSLKEIKVLSLTGHAVGGMLETTMTSMELPAHDIGIRAAQMLIEEIEAPTDKLIVPQHLKLATILVERETT